MAPTSRPLPPSIVQEFGRALNEARAQLLGAVATTEAELHTVEEREIGGSSEITGDRPRGRPPGRRIA
jgi:hypothetical protein